MRFGKAAQRFPIPGPMGRLATFFEKLRAVTLPRVTILTLRLKRRYRMADLPEGHSHFRTSCPLSGDSRLAS